VLWARRLANERRSLRLLKMHYEGLPVNIDRAGARDDRVIACRFGLDILQFARLLNTVRRLRHECLADVASVNHREAGERGNVVARVWRDDAAAHALPCSVELRRLRDERLGRSDYDEGCRECYRMSTHPPLL